MTQTIRQRQAFKPYVFTREVIREVPPDLAQLRRDIIDEDCRQAYIQQSASTVGGVVAPFRRQ